MSDVFKVVAGAFVMFLMVVSVFAWLVVLPTVGLLYLCGFLG